VMRVAERTGVPFAEAPPPARAASGRRAARGGRGVAR